MPYKKVLSMNAEVGRWKIISDGIETYFQEIKNLLSKCHRKEATNRHRASRPMG